MQRIIQYIQRWANIYLTTLPGSYQQRKVELIQDFFIKVNGLMLSLEKEYWIDFGTLLGYYREGRIIPYDIDVDFGMHEKYYQYVLNLGKQLPKGMTLYDSTCKHRGPKVYFSYKGIDADVYFYEDLGETIKSYENSQYPNEISEIPKSLIFPLREGCHLGQKTFLPAKTKEYLEHVYGYIGKDAVRNKETGYWSKKA